MLVVLVSNYFNHHQAPFAKEMDRLTNHNFYFVETKPLENERKQMGWGQEQLPAYVIQAYGDRRKKENCQKLINDADVVIWGSCPMKMIRPRLRRHKLTFAYSERIFKTGKTGFGYWGRMLKYYCKLKPYQKNHYLLCASAYAAEDYAEVGLFKGGAYKWGYFPEVKRYDDIDELIRNKDVHSLLWVGRLIPWKHPEIAIEVAKCLQQQNIDFHLKIIGCGEMEGVLSRLIYENHLENRVSLMGSMTPDEVRQQMEKTQIFLFTSDQNEGWGAVLNEAMNSGCVVIGNRQIGAVPYLLQDGYNGLIYSVNKAEVLSSKVKTLLTNDAILEKLGNNAYKTLVSTWNANIAAERFCSLVNNCGLPETDGPLQSEE